MFSFLRKKKQHPASFAGMTDSHSHILPGVDDGVREMETSLSILHHYEKLGISEVWFTPHIMEDVPNTTEDLKARFEQFKKEYDGPVKLHLAAEYMMDYAFEQRLADRDLLEHGPGRVLVETSYLEPPAGLDNILFNIQAAGYTPILAHPERYLYMDMGKYPKLHELGILFQLNWGSLGGLYGKHVQERAFRLLKDGLYDMSGSDIHTRRMYPYYEGILLDEGDSLPCE
ncbi:MAG: capsular biosynthesis protein [Bacteroidales bacterium]|nr:capsular biosynthesis protein [Bacteroidales bacterium]